MGFIYVCLTRGRPEPEVNKTTVSVQLKGYFFNVSQSKGAIFDNLTETNVRPLFFRYASWDTSEGKIHYSSLNESGVYEDLLCEGVAFPMSLLGDGAIVQLIIPFDLGPSQNYTAGNSLFVEQGGLYLLHEAPAITFFSSPYDTHQVHLGYTRDYRGTCHRWPQPS